MVTNDTLCYMKLNLPFLEAQFDKSYSGSLSLRKKLSKLVYFSNRTRGNSALNKWQ